MPVMQTSRETCSDFIALTSACVAVESKFTSRNGLAPVQHGILTAEGFAQGLLVADVTGDDSRALEITRLLGRAHQTMTSQPCASARLTISRPAPPVAPTTTIFA
jgi:hypothetical protein